MTQFADLNYLEDFLGKSFPPDKQAQANLMLTLATASIQTECRQLLVKAEGDVIEMRPPTEYRQIVLPERPVIKVNSLTIGGFIVPEGSFEVTRWGRVRTFGSFSDQRSWVINAPFIDEADWPPLVVVDYDHGYEDAEIPEDLKSICAAAAARALRNPESYDREEIGATYKVYYGDAKGIRLTADEKATLRRWRQTSAG